MKLWVDDIREMPDGYTARARTVNNAIHVIEWWERHCRTRLETDGLLLDLDHDAGRFYHDGGDYIKILDWLEERQPTYPVRIHIHSMNCVGALNMRQIIQHNHWIEV